MAEVIYICNADKSNKFWSYEITGKSVHIKWGRIGGTSDEQTKSFDSDYKLQAFLQGKIREKEKKSYKLVDKTTLKQETEVANDLGARNKIKVMHFVSRKGDVLEKLDNYDSKQWVYVEVLDSWSKDVTRLVLSKDDTYQLTAGIQEQGRKLITNGMRQLGYEHPFASAVRKILRRTAEKVVEVLKSVKFAAVGARSLFDDDAHADQVPEVQSALAAIDFGGVDSGVISKFAAMGSRVLEL